MYRRKKLALAEVPVRAQIPPEKAKKNSLVVRSLFQNKVAGWKPEIVKSGHKRCSLKKCVLKNFANFTAKDQCWSFFLIKLEFYQPGVLRTLLKKDSDTGHFLRNL